MFVIFLMSLSLVVLGWSVVKDTCIFTDRLKAVLLLWIIFVCYASCWCVLCCRVCSV